MSNPNRATLRIVAAIAHHFHLEPSDVLSESQLATRVLARQITMYVLREHQKPTPSLEEIASQLGRERSTVHAALRQVADRAPDDPVLRDAIEIGRQALLGDGFRDRLAKVRRMEALRREADEIEREVREAAE